MKFEEFAEKFREWYEADKSPKTIECYACSLKKLLKAFTGRDLKKVTIRSKGDWTTLDMRVLRRMLHLAEEWGDLDLAPRIHIPQENSRTRYLSREEIREMLDECEDPDLGMVIRAGMGTGLRKENLLRLKWEQIDFGSGFVKLIVKRGKELYIPTPASLSAQFKRYRETRPKDDLFVFPQDKHYEGRFARLVKRLGLKDVTFHTLRHTYGSWLTMSGVDLLTVRDLMGHSSVQTTERYLHISTPHKQAAVEKLPQAMFQEGGKGFLY